MAYYRIAQFPGRGRGLEAVRDIPEGTIILSTPCVIVPKNEIYGSLANYVFRWEDQRAVALGDASLLNHTAPGNCEFYRDPVNTAIVVKTRRPIRRGEELTIDYGWHQPDFVEIAAPAPDAEEGERRACLELVRAQRDSGKWAEAGLGLPLPAQDVLYVEDHIYEAGLREEYSIAAYYSPDPARRTHGHCVCNTLALEIQSAMEILAPADLPAPAYPLVQGFEDFRLFAWHDGLWGVACVRQLTEEGWCEQVLARIDEPRPGICRLADWRVLRPSGPRLHEKNWMPQVASKAGGECPHFIYRCDPTRVLDEEAGAVGETIPAIAAEHFSGGSQAIAFDRGWLALIHEAPGETPRSCQHRFVWFDRANALRRVSRAFYFQRRGVEFAAGLAWHPDGERLLVSWGVGDGEAWIATVAAGEVRALLDDAAHLPSGMPNYSSASAQGCPVREADCV